MKRIQRKRTKGWRMPPNTVYVGRGSKYGNPYQMLGECDRDQAVAWYAEHVLPTIDVTDLVGKDLACWCPLPPPCHADLLLQKAQQKANSYNDALVMAIWLLGEDARMWPPDVKEVMGRWEPVALAAFRKKDAEERLDRGKND